MRKWKQQSLKSVFACSLLIHCASARPTLTQETYFDYPADKPRIKVTVVASTGLESRLPDFVKMVEKGMKQDEKIFSLQYQDSFSVVFDNRPDFDNGITTVVPTDRIVINTESSFLESEVGLARDVHYETVVHELSHMLVTQQRRGIFRPLSWLFGNTSRPLAVFPRWVHEGMAVWAESSYGGGRGGLGVVDADLRKYSDYYQRHNGKHPLTSDKMDGSLELNSVDDGDAPYQFGYLLMKDVVSYDDPAKNGELLDRRATNLGFFFHRLFRDDGKVLTDRFNALREEWAKTLPPTKTEIKAVREAKNIFGPFVSTNGYSWIEWSKSEKSYAPIHFVYRNGNESFTTHWPQAMVMPFQVSWSDSHHAWIMMATEIEENTNKLERRRIYLVEKSGSIRCTLDLGRLREFTAEGSTLAWISDDDSGLFSFEKADLSKQCTLDHRQTILKPDKAFVRLSHPWIHGNDWLVAESDGSDLSRDMIVGPSTHVQLAEGALGTPAWIESEGCAPHSCLLATWYSKNYRGPVLLRKEASAGAGQSGQFKASTFFVRTEASRALQDPRSKKFIAIENLWEKDRVRSFDIKEASAQKIVAPKMAEMPNVEGKEPVETKPYGIWPSIFPQFWYPWFETTQYGTALAGNTFFTDLSGDWRGLATLGYDTGAHRPLAELDVTKNNLSSGMLDQFNFSGGSSYRYINNLVQGNLLVLSNIRLLLPVKRFTLGILPGVDYLYGDRAGTVKNYSTVAPTVSLLVKSPQAVDVSQQQYQISKFRNAFYLLAKSRWLPETNLTVDTNFQGHIEPFGYLLGAQYASASVKSFPKVFYFWGGLPTFSTLDLGFLARGYPIGINPSMQILRGYAETGFKVFSFQRGLAWNRLHVSDIEFRPIFETITTDLYDATGGTPVKTSIRMGKRYFSTAGGAIDVFSQALHYVDFKTSFGVFRGLDRGGETAYNINFVVNLDFLDKLPSVRHP